MLGWGGEETRFFKDRLESKIKSVCLRVYTLKGHTEKGAKKDPEDLVFYSLP